MTKILTYQSLFFVPPPQPTFLGIGSQIQNYQPPHQPREKRGAIVPRDDGNQNPQPRFLGIGSQIQNYQPQHPRREKFGAIITDDDGSESPFVFVPPSTLSPTVLNILFQPPGQRVRQRYAGIKGKASFGILPQFLPYGFHVQPWQPPHPRREKFGAIIPDEDGSESPFVFVPPTTIPATIFDIAFQPPQFPKARQRYAGIKGKSGFTLFANWKNAGWELQSIQPPQPKGRKFGAIITDEDGSESPFVPPVTTPLPPTIYDISFQPPGPRFRQRYPGTKGKSEFAIPLQFTIAPAFQSSDLKTPIKQRGNGASGNSQFAAFSTYPWTESLAWQPYRLRYRGSFLVGDAGNQNPTTPVVVVTSSWGFDPQPYQNRIRPKGSFLIGDPGNQNAFIPPPIVTSNWGFDLQPYQPQRIIRKGGGLARSDDGNQRPLINFFPLGWPVQSFQPPHRRFNNLDDGDKGIEAKFIFVPLPFFTIAWQVQAFQPPHPRPERGGGWMPHDDGNENIYIFVPPPPTTVRDPFVKREDWRRYQKQRRKLEAAQLAREKAELRAKDIKRKALRDLVLGITDEAHDALIAAEEAPEPAADVPVQALTDSLKAIISAKGNKDMERIALQTQAAIREFHKYIGNMKYIKEMNDDEDDLEIILRDLF